jgi:hypothetical protein
MQADVTPQEARAALEALDRGRLHIIEEIEPPRWYWWGLALGWVALGIVTDLGNPWLASAGTLLFGAVHASVAPRVVSGRRRTTGVSVSADVIWPYTAQLVIGSLVLLGALTIGGSLALSADGARDPVTITSIFIAILILLGGPMLFASIRQRAAQRTSR